MTLERKTIQTDITPNNTEAASETERKTAQRYLDQWTPYYKRIVEIQKKRKDVGEVNPEAEWLGAVVEDMIVQLAEDTIPDEMKKPEPELTGINHGGYFFDKDTGYDIEVVFPLGIHKGVRSVNQAIWFRNKFGAIPVIMEDLVHRTEGKPQPEFVKRIEKLYRSNPNRNSIEETQLNNFRFSKQLSFPTLLLFP